MECSREHMSASESKNTPILAMKVNRQQFNMPSEEVIAMLNDMRLEGGWLEPLPGKHALIEELIPDVKARLDKLKLTPMHRTRLEKMLSDLKAMQMDKGVDLALYSKTIQSIQHGTCFRNNQTALPMVRARLRAYLEKMQAHTLSPMELRKCSAVVAADKEFARILQSEADDEMEKLYATFSKLSTAASSSAPKRLAQRSKRKH